MKCRKGFEIQTLKSNAGYYKGTLDEDGLPNCRISSGYKKTKEDGDKLLCDRNAMENKFCNGNKGCIECEDEE